MQAAPAGRIDPRPASVAAGYTSRWRWYAGRLRAMSAAEVVHRVGEAWVKRRWAARPIGWDGTIGDGPLGSSDLLGRRLRSAAGLPAVVRSATEARSGRLRFLGHAWPGADWRAGGGEFWRYDPVTGRHWPGPPTPAAAIDLRATGTDPSGPGLGDAKFVWEPGRLQCLHALAAEGDGASALAILRHFCEANPPYAGIHWTSGIEIALRLVAVTLVGAGCGAEAFGADDRILIRRFAAAHGAYLAAFPSLHSSANNHRMAEGLGLLLAGLLVPDLGPGWAAQGRGIVEDRVRALVLPDGSGAEQAPVYLAFVLEMAALAALLAEEAGLPLAADVMDRLARGAGFLGALLDRGGQAPAIGDDDETRVIAVPGLDEPRYVASVAAAVAGLVRRPDLAPPGRDPHLRDALFAAPPGPGPVAAGLRTFPDGGLSTAHEILGGRQVHLVFDHGPLGHGTLAAHGHADALAVWLSVDGEPVLIDAGTWLYFSGGAGRLCLRESPSHNTVSLHGASQSCASSAFGWTNRARASLLAGEPGPDWSLTGRHDGYRRRYGVDHLRRVTRAGDALLIGDRLAGGTAPAEIGFLLPGDLTVALSGRDVAIGRAGVPLCRMRAPEGFALALRRGAAEGAVRSRRFGVLEEAQRLVISGPLGDAEAVTELHFAPAPGSPTMARDSLGAGEAGRHGAPRDIPVPPQAGRVPHRDGPAVLASSRGDDEPEC